MNSTHVTIILVCKETPSIKFKSNTEVFQPESALILSERFIKLSPHLLRALSSYLHLYSSLSILDNLAPYLEKEDSVSFKRL